MSSSPPVESLLLWVPAVFSMALVGCVAAGVWTLHPLVVGPLAYLYLTPLLERCGVRGRFLELLPRCVKQLSRLIKEARRGP